MKEFKFISVILLFCIVSVENSCFRNNNGSNMVQQFTQSAYIGTTAVPNVAATIKSTTRTTTKKATKKSSRIT